LELLQTRVNNLKVRSPGTGMVRIIRQHHLPGSFFKQGDELAIIERPDSVRVRTALLQEEVGLVRQMTSGVAVRLASNPAQVIHADILQDVPIATLDLPSQVLGAQGGGRLAVDVRQPGGTRVTEQVFLLDLLLRDYQQSGHYGERTYVKFSHPARPLMAQWYSALQQVFIRHFS
jgi:putative peptide zinc metalloprotease protein